jgi:hypothetical protein
MLSQHGGQFVAHGLDHLLVRRKLQHHLAANGLLPDVGEQLVRNAHVDVAFEQRLANLRQRCVQVLLGQLSLPAQVLECPLQLLRQILKHIRLFSSQELPLYRNCSRPASAAHSFDRFWPAGRSLRTLRYRDAHKRSGTAKIFVCCGKRQSESLCNGEIGRIIIREATNLCKGRQLQNFGGRLLRDLDWKGLQPHKESVNLVQRDTLAA